ncbi:MAG: Oligopeptide transport ATP-binding protein OppF [Chlamydiae bacterium]|nr:Oligopeptide transport ATP-binding protein OppF [Chlamydiota bacterium]
MNEPLLIIKNLSKSLKTSSHNIHILKNVSLKIQHQSNLAILGQSGSGKTTLARILVGLDKQNSGIISHISRNLNIQMVYQNPYESLTPHMTISELLQDHTTDIEEIHFYFDKLNLKSSILNSYPHELSGGEAQRIALMRALLLKPNLLICDEILSALDSMVQKQVLELLKETQRIKHFSVLWISHDLLVAQNFCDELAILNGGVIVETGEASELIQSPKHDYTKKLIHAMEWIIS